MLDFCSNTIVVLVQDDWVKNNGGATSVFQQDSEWPIEHWVEGWGWQ